MFNNTILLFKKTAYDLLQPMRFGVSKDYDFSGNTPFHRLPYALDFTASGMLDAYDMIRDSSGTVMYPHYLINGQTGSHYYSPLKIAHYILAIFNDYLRSDDVSLTEDIRHHLNFLLEIGSTHPNDSSVCVWRVPTSVLRYGVKSQHVSAIVQGLVISAFLRGFVLWGDERFLETARRASRLMSIPLEDDGVQAASRWGTTYEEYPSDPYSHVINGFIFSLFGLYELSQITKDSIAEELYWTGISSLKKMAPDWIMGYWSKYDLFDLTSGANVNLATRHYQYLHIDQLQVLFRQTGDSVFREMEHELVRQMRNPFSNARVYLNKAHSLLPLLNAGAKGKQTLS
jgi:hypothetical protein